MTELADLKARILVNPEARAEHDAQAPEFELARELITARTRAGLTQSEPAERMHTTQSTIARLEENRGLSPTVPYYFPFYFPFSANCASMSIAPCSTRTIRTRPSSSKKNTT